MHPTLCIQRNRRRRVTRPVQAAQLHRGLHCQCASDADQGHCSPQRHPRGPQAGDQAHHSGMTSRRISQREKTIKTRKNRPGPPLRYGIYKSVRTKKTDQTRQNRPDPPTVLGAPFPLRLWPKVLALGCCFRWLPFRVVRR